MKISVKAAVRAAAQILGVSDDVEARLNGEETEEGQRALVLLVNSFNHVENELALDYLPLVAEEEKSSVDGVVPYAELSHPAARILRVEDAEGKGVEYKLFPDHLQTKAGKVKVSYSYCPKEKDIDGESDYQTAASERIFVYGMAAEYALAEGELEAAKNWDKKYKEAIAATYRMGTSKQIRSRRWI